MDNNFYTELEKLLKEYQEGHDVMYKRIIMLDNKIKTAGKAQPTSQQKLLDERAILYGMLWDMEYAINGMRDYIRARDLREDVESTCALDTVISGAAKDKNKQECKQKIKCPANGILVVSKL